MFLNAVVQESPVTRLAYYRSERYRSQPPPLWGKSSRWNEYDWTFEYTYSRMPAPLLNMRRPRSLLKALVPFTGSFGSGYSTNPHAPSIRKDLSSNMLAGRAFCVQVTLVLCCAWAARGAYLIDFSRVFHHNLANVKREGRLKLNIIVCNIIARVYYEICLWLKFLSNFSVLFHFFSCYFNENYNWKVRICSQMLYLKKHAVHFR